MNQKSRKSKPRKSRNACNKKHKIFGEALTITIKPMKKTNNHGCMCVYCNNTKKLILMGGAWRSAEASSISKQSKQAKKEEGILESVQCS